VNVCLQNNAQQEAFERLDMLSKLASTSGYNPRTIIKNVVSGLSDDARCLLPSIESMRGRINRKRKEVAGFGKDANPLEDIVIPEELKKTIDGSNDFLFYDSGKEDKDRILIFITEENLRWLNKLRDWLGDGTFDIAPKIFTQLNTIHGLKGHKTIPLLYAFLPNKKKENYVKLFKAILPKIKHLPHSFNVDFEQAVFGAIKEVFPNCEIFGCYFHLSQNMF
jgi:hypothetical protein